MPVALSLSRMTSWAWRHQPSGASASCDLRCTQLSRLWRQPLVKITHNRRADRDSQRRHFCNGFCFVLFPCCCIVPPCQACSQPVHQPILKPGLCARFDCIKLIATFTVRRQAFDSATAGGIMDKCTFFRNIHRQRTTGRQCWPRTTQHSIPLLTEECGVRPSFKILTFPEPLRQSQLMPASCGFRAARRMQLSSPS